MFGVDFPFLKIVVFAMVGVAPGCLGAIPDIQTIDERERYVKLQARNGGTGIGTPPEFSHPFALSQEEWGRIFQGISVKPRKWFLSIGEDHVNPEPAFTNAEQAYLAEYFANAFSKARDDQVVVFYLSRPREDDLTEISSGGGFVLKGRIHFLIANFRYVVSGNYLQKRIRDHPLRPVGELFYEFLPSPHHTVRSIRSSDLPAPPWFQVLDLSIEYGALLELSAKPGSSTESVGTKSGLNQDEQTSLEKRLRTLEHLRNQGLLTEEEYHNFRERMLQEL